MSALIKIWFKEYKKMFSDGGTIMLFFIAIIIYPVLYSLAYNNEQAKEIPIIVVDESHSDLSRQLIRMVDATDEVKVIDRVSDFRSAEEKFNEGKIYGIIYIPEEFEKNILRFESAHVSVYADAAYMVIYKQILTAASYSIGTMSAGVEIQRRMAKGEALEVAYYERNPLPLETYALYNPNGGYATYAMPAVLLLILQQTLLLGIGLLGGSSNEFKKEHYLAPIVAKRGGTLSVLLGKMLAYFTLYLMNSIFVLVIIFRIFKLPMRTGYPEMFVFIVPFLISVIFLGMFISAFFKHRESSMMILLFTSIPFIFLSGFSWPVESMPAWLQHFSQIIPSTPAIKGFLALTQKGAPFSDVTGYWIHLWILTVVYLLLAFIMLKLLFKRIEKREVV